MTVRSRVVVIGGGITGLAAAERIVARMGAGSITLIESAPALGGKIVTEHADGFVFERGPDSFLASKPQGIALCEQLGLEVIETNATMRRSFVKRAGRLFPLPEGLTGLVPSRLKPLLSTGILSRRGKVRAAMELLVPRAHGDGDESVGAFVRRRFGNEAWRWIVEPLLSGIYAGDGDVMSLRATFPQLRETERRHGSILRPLLFTPVSSVAARRGFVSLPGGMQQLSDALASRLAGERVLTGTSVASVAHAARGYIVTLTNGETVTAASVIAAVPAHAAAPMLQSIDPLLAEELETIPFVSTATVSLIFKRSDLSSVLDGFGYVSPRAEGGAVIACTWTSNKFPSRVPAGHVLLRLFIGRAGSDAIVEAVDDALVTIARDELRRVHGITAVPRLVRIARWPRAMPQYTMGHGERVTRILALANAHPGLFVAGASYRGVGIPDCIASGWSAADAVISHLQAS